MKTNLNDTQDSPNKNLKSKHVSEYDKYVCYLLSKRKCSPQDFMKLYFLDKLKKKDIDYLFCNNDKNIDTTDFNVLKLNYKLFYEAFFTGGTITTCHKSSLFAYSIVKLELNSECNESIQKYVKIDDYVKLLEVSHFTEVCNFLLKVIRSRRQKTL
jgi:hypothetical protein